LSENKTARELAIELTTAIVKARGDVIASINHNTGTVQQLDKWLSTSEILDVFEKTYSSIKDK